MPALQFDGALDPAKQNVPARHSVQSPLLPSPGLLLYVPFSHGSGALLRSSQKEPATQSKHAVWPLMFMNVPGAHASHEPMLAFGCTVPGLHGVGAKAPVEQKDPAGHGGQSSTVGMSERSPSA